ncbi:hypothetical protein Q9L58_002822 [Maublancomyces gigas]|uniref:Major facilitator superfamily (MFS) profile domain-containing protein n=1 Tax=Discina gigas TaxID=1032678 RepID=A0ABR3GQJ9_9PEZI
MSASTSISQTPAENTEKSAAGGIEFQDWSTLDDSEVPYNWTNKRKWLVTIVFCLNNFMVSVGASIFTPAIGLIAHTFDVTIVVATLGLSFYVLGFSMGPLVFAPMSEVYGRKIVNIPTWALFVIFQIGCALAKNIQTLVICRFLVGTFGSPALTVAAGTMTDIWKPNELGPPMGLFTMAAFSGPVVGPIAGGFIADYLHSSESWRWSFWIPFIISGVLGLNWLWLPETYQITLLEAKAKKAGHQALHAEGGKSKAAIFRVAVGRPLHMLVFEPTVLLVSLYISFLFGIL